MSGDDWPRPGHARRQTNPYSRRLLYVRRADEALPLVARRERMAKGESVSTKDLLLLPNQTRYPQMQHAAKSRSLLWPLIVWNVLPVLHFVSFSR